MVQLKHDFQLKISEAESLKLDLEKAESTLGAATSLLGKLSGEKGRWEEQVRIRAPAIEMPSCSHL